MDKDQEKILDIMAKVEKSNRRKTVKDEFWQTEIWGGPSPLYTYPLLLLPEVWSY